MKIAIVYNRESERVINLFGLPSREKLVEESLNSILAALKGGGHRVKAIEGDKDLLDKLENFMPRVVRGEQPGIVFNVAYGIQGQSRYTHVPSLLEMVGLPYVGSGPLAHSLALDKVVSKLIFRQKGLPTPDFAVLDSPDSPAPDLEYPLVIKPKNEALSLGLRIVENERALRRGVAEICKEFQQSVLVERYLPGPEINVGVVGNSPPEAFPPVLLRFAEGGPPIYTHDDKTGEEHAGRVEMLCPAPLDAALVRSAQELAVAAFQALGCCDLARVDLRLDGNGLPSILEVNSQPGLGEASSFATGAAQAGIDYTTLINRVVAEASTRYFGTREPRLVRPSLGDAPSYTLSYITRRRERLERRLQEWIEQPRRTDDAVGLRYAADRLEERFHKLGLTPVRELTRDLTAWTWRTQRGLDDATLLIANLDTLANAGPAVQRFRRDPLWLYGDGAASSSAALVMLEFALRPLRALHCLDDAPVAVLVYADEGEDARHSGEMIRQAAARARRVLVLAPPPGPEYIVTQRLGQRRYGLRVEGEPTSFGRTSPSEPLRWIMRRLDEMSRLTSARQRIAVTAVDLHVNRLAMKRPHQATAKIIVTYPSLRAAAELDARLRELCAALGPRHDLELLSDRRPYPERRGNLRLADALLETAARWDIPLQKHSSSWPSVAGLVPAKIPCVCGLAPAGRDLRTPGEAVERIGLVRRTLLLGEYLAKEAGD